MDKDEQWVEAGYALEAANGFVTVAAALRVPVDGSDSNPPGFPAPVFPLADEATATGVVGEVFTEMREFYESATVPNLFRAMAVEPGWLQEQWRFWRQILQDSHLPRLTKQTIAYAAAATARDPYSMDWHLRELRRLGADDHYYLEVLWLVERFNGITKFADLLEVEPDFDNAQLQAIGAHEHAHRLG